MPPLPFPEIIDNTALSSFKKCPRDWYYSTLRELTKQGGNIHLHAGGAYASGLEHARRAFYEEGLSEEEAIVEGATALTRYWGEFEPTETDKKTFPTMLGALLEYFCQYPMADDIIKPYMLPSGKAAVEFTFAIPFPGVSHPTTGQPLIYSGRFDMLGQRAGALFVEDDKTASQLGNQWNRNWDLDSQFTGYCWAAKEYGFPVAGALIRGISIRSKGYGHAQAIVYRPDWQIEQWLASTAHQLRLMIAYWQEQTFHGVYDKHACNSYGGCQFAQLCASPNPEGWIPQYFEKRIWNHLAKGDESALPPELHLPLV